MKRSLVLETSKLRPLDQRQFAAHTLSIFDGTFTGFSKAGHLKVGPLLTRASTRSPHRRTSPE